MTNPAREMLSRVINRAIENGAIPIVERPSLDCLKERSSRLWDSFLAECQRHGFADQWQAYRSLDAGGDWPAGMESAWQAYNKALHDYYAARDGIGGFLGSRGL